jgi:hypothetical protein
MANHKPFLFVRLGTGACAVRARQLTASPPATNRLTDRPADRPVRQMSLRASRFAEAKNGFATSAPGPGAYESHKHLSLGVDTTNMGPAPTMSALSSYAARAAAARSPGPVYNTSRELGDSGPCAQPPHRPDRRPHVTTLAAAYALHAAGAGLPPPPCLLPALY